MSEPTARKGSKWKQVVAKYNAKKAASKTASGGSVSSPVAAIEPKKVNGGN